MSHADRTFRLALGSIVALASIAFVVTNEVRACGPSSPLSSAEVLRAQLDVIDRGLRREELSDETRAQVLQLRSRVESLQMAGKRREARAVMQKIVSMFAFKELVEPLVPGCGPMAPTRVRKKS